ncbi:SLC13 family permease [Brevibacillus choshinensis]|uniref:SLC13 family permease n=1 Tax=Brevibacillus choshinensis TaxID=54911 RepID=UPI002E20F2AD|nr:SLC13 family permease [Brevibacillus choshinensis]MED4584258.1 SLC13 family permease [Brevibacillus choshinensis]MED4755141.1 SLC13 family permease [Brevibacillus choshinensis]MED4784191.1 SLC13 family permease [Brevibacillus choshinensis]
MTTLQGIGMFKQLSNIELAKLLGKLELRIVTVGTVLFRQGDPGDRLYVIKSGKLELYVEATTGRSPQMISVLGEGDTLGEMAMLTGEARSATAIAATDAELYIIDRETFQGLVEEQPSISTYFIRLLSRRLTTTNEQLMTTKELTSQAIAKELDAFPPQLVHLLLCSSPFPRISGKWLTNQFGIDLEEALESMPALKRFIEEVDQSPGWYTLVSDTRQVIAEIATVRFGHEEKRKRMADMLSFYEATEEWEATVELLGHSGRWSEVLEVVDRVGSLIDIDRQKRLYKLLLACPPQYIVSSFERLSHCLAHVEPEAGLALLDRAWSEHGERYTNEQWIATYECAAHIQAQLGRHQQSMEYLTLAEARKSITGIIGLDKGPGSHLVQQQLARGQLRRLAGSAGGLFQRSRLGGWIATVLVLVSLVFFHYMEPFGGLSRTAMDFIGVGIAAVILWIVNLIPDYIVSLGMVMAWVLGGLVTPEVALSGFASTTWLYMIFIMAFIAAITRSGILYRVSLNALKRFPRHYRGQLWGVVAGGILLNPLIPSSSAKVSLGVPLARTLSESMGFASNSRGAAGLGLASMVFYGFTAPFVLTGSYTNMMAYGLASIAEPINWLQWFFYALPAFVVFAVVMLILLHIMFRDVRQVRPISDDVLDEQLRLLGPWTSAERIAVMTTLGSIALLILQPLHGIDSAWIMLAGFAILVITGALDRQTVSTGIDWTFLLFLGVAFSFAAATQVLGIADALSSFLGNHLAMFLSSPGLLLTVLILVSFLVTLVIRDDPAVILLVTALLPLAEKAGIHPWIFIFVILLATDPFFFTYQSPTYLTAYYSSDGKAFTHRQGQKIALAYALAIVLAITISVPYWKWIGLIS